MVAEIEVDHRGAERVERHTHVQSGGCDMFLTDGKVTLSICGRRATYEAKRESAGVLWCFGCRRRLEHDWVITADVEPSYYGPTITRECSSCGQDRTSFPGREHNYYPDDW